MMVGTAQKFPAGPVEVPSDRRPKLLMEWTLTFRVRLDNPFEAIPPRRVIARQYMPGDTTGGSCWAIYNQVRDRSLASKDGRCRYSRRFLSSRPP